MDTSFGIRQLIANEDLVVWARQGDSGLLVVCFSGIGKDTEQTPPIEFARTASGDGRHSVLFISDPRRSWLNTPGLIDRIAEIVAEFGDETKADRIATLGHSMGGFSAIVLAAKLNAVSAVAYAPQVSVHPEIAGDDQRWMNWRDRITRFNVASAAQYIADGPAYHVFHGRHGREAPQRDRVPFRPNLTHTILPNTHHNVPARLKQAGVLGAVTESCFENRHRRVRLLLKPMRAYRRIAETAELRASSAELTQVVSCAR